MPDFAELLEGEPLQVARWRREQLLDLGLSENDAERFALGTIDVRRFEAIIQAGCPTTVAVAIFA